MLIVVVLALIAVVVIVIMAIIVGLFLVKFVLTLLPHGAEYAV